MGFFPRSPSFTNLSFLELPAPVTGDSYLLHTVRVFVGKRGLTYMQNIVSPSTYCSDGICSIVGDFIRRLPIHMLQPAYGARRSPLIYPANRIRSYGRLRHIRCYKLCHNDNGLWCWDATTQAAIDDAPCQRRSWRGVSSFFFKVRAHQGRVTLSQKSLRGVRTPTRQFFNLSELKYFQYALNYVHAGSEGRNGYTELFQ